MAWSLHLESKHFQGVRLDMPTRSIAGQSCGWIQGDQLLRIWYKFLSLRPHFHWPQLLTLGFCQFRRHYQSRWLGQHYSFLEWIRSCWSWASGQKFRSSKESKDGRAFCLAILSAHKRKQTPHAHASRLASEIDCTSNQEGLGWACECQQPGFPLLSWTRIKRAGQETLDTLRRAHICFIIDFLQGSIRISRFLNSQQIVSHLPYLLII